MMPGVTPTTPTTTRKEEETITFDDYLNHISRRVTLSAVAGALGGGLYGVLKGYDRPFVRTATRTSVSCAMVATACLSCERLIHAVCTKYVVQQQQQQQTDGDDEEKRFLVDSNNRDSRLLYGTHALGGFVGGAVLGALYIKRPLRGALFMTPIMLTMAGIEQQFSKLRRQALEQRQQQEILEQETTR